MEVGALMYAALVLLAITLVVNVRRRARSSGARDRRAAGVHVRKEVAR